MLRRLAGLSSAGDPRKLEIAFKLFILKSLQRFDATQNFPTFFEVGEDGGALADKLVGAAGEKVEGKADGRWRNICLACDWNFG